MGHKTHPVGFRLGIIKEWDGRWFAPNAREYRTLLQEDLRLRQAVEFWYPGAGVARIEIERSAQEVEVTIWTARPGIVIGRQGQRVEETRQSLEALTDRKVRVSVQEVRTTELNAALVARNVAEQLERRVAYRRAMLQTATRSMQAGADGIKIVIKGRLGGAEIARREKIMLGRVPLHTIRADVDFAIAEGHTVMGRIGVKGGIYKGDIIPAREQAQVEEMAPIQVTLRADEQEEIAEEERQEDAAAETD